MPTTLHFQAETITPLVIAGADNRTPNVLGEGLRPPSLRGVMRWWFRAMMGGIIGAHGTYGALRTLEARFFGVADQASAFRLRTSLINMPPKSITHLRMNDPSPIQHGKQMLRAERMAIMPSAKFKVQLAFNQQDAVASVLGALWLTVMLGGLGGRSRRGFGSLTFTPEDEQTKQKIQELGLDFSYPEKSLKEIKSALEAQLEKVHGYLSGYVPSIGSPSSANFPVLSQTQAKLWLIKPRAGFWTGWEDAMNGLREDVYRAYKKSKTPPLQEIGSANPRLASPLLIQIKRVASNKYLGVLLAFDEASTPSGYRRYLGANLGDFINFLNKMRTKYEYAEVSLP